MDAIAYSTARAKLADTMDRVCDDHELIVITRDGQQSVVMMSLEDFNGTRFIKPCVATQLDVLGSPTGAARSRAAWAGR